VIREGNRKKTTCKADDDGTRWNELVQEGKRTDDLSNVEDGFPGGGQGVGIGGAHSTPTQKKRANGDGRSGSSKTDTGIGGGGEKIKRYLFGRGGWKGVT